MGAALPGDRVVVVGAGVVGALTAYLLARIPGAEVTLVDTDPAKRRLAEALGLPFALGDAAPKGADLVVEASGRGARAQERARARRLRGDRPGARLVRQRGGGAALGGRRSTADGCAS